jgi:hypothetical protein
LGETLFEVSTGKQFRRPHLQIIREKWTGDMAQMVEHLLCNCEAPTELKLYSHQKEKKNF